MKYNDGYSSITVLILILFFSTIAGSIFFYIHLSQNQYSRNENHYLTVDLLENEAYALIEELSKDPSPEGDSSLDPVWDYIDSRNAEGVTISLTDLSSRFNLNFVRTKMLEESSFKQMMINGHSPEDLKQYRGEYGFFTDLSEGYGDYFDDETLDKYFTSYGYANLNVTYEDSLKKIYEYRVADEGSHVFLGSVQQLISEQVLADDNRMRVILGSDYESLFPLINIEPLMNVNFVDEEILKAVLQYPYGEETHPEYSSFFEIIKAERVNLEISQDRLKSIINVEGQYLRMLQYLGTKTWFWGMDIVQDDVSLHVVVARKPDSLSDLSYNIIEWYISQ